MQLTYLVLNIALTGGEPTIYPYILDVTSYAMSICDKVLKITNGWYITSESRLSNAIEYILELKSSYPCYVKIATLYTGYNIDNVESVLDYAEEKDRDLYFELLYTKIPFFRKFLLSSERKPSNLSGGVGIEADIDTIIRWKKQGRKVLISDEGIRFIKAWF